MIRTFIAIELPEDVRALFEELQNGMRSFGVKARWVRPSNIHLTLKFLGDIDEGRVDSIDLEIKNTLKRHAAFKLQARGLGVFPGIKRPRVLWVGLSGQVNQLIDLQKELELGFEALGFPREKRPFKGHLTIGRFKQRTEPGKILDAMKTFNGFTPREFMVRDVTFYKSVLKQTGAEYTRLTHSALPYFDPIR